MERFLEVLPKRHRYAFELRNPTWHTETVYRILRKHNVAFCIFQIADVASDYQVTANFTYVRLHGPGGAYQGSYSARQLERWAERVQTWQKQLDAIYIYFDNDQAAYAVENALALKRLLG